MAQAAFGRAIMASGATLLVLGGGTVAISGITMTVTKAVVDKARVSRVPCVGCACPHRMHVTVQT